MFECSFETHISAAHQIIGHQGKCARLHGHNWRILVRIAANQAEILLQFSSGLREMIHGVSEKYDHLFLNELPAFQHCNSTAENMSRVLYEDLQSCLRSQFGENQDLRLCAVTVWETPHYSATYHLG